MQTPLRRLVNTFVTGALAALPLAATVAILVWAARLAADYLGPHSLIGRALSSIGLGLGRSEVFAYAIGVAAVLLAIFLLGIVVQTRLRRVFAWATDSFVRRIPVVRGVYDTISKFVSLLGQGQDEPAGTRSMSPVWLHFGGVGGVAVLGLLSTPEPIRLGDIDYYAVLVPTAPVPVGGGLLYAPVDWVRPAEVGVDGLTSIYVSMGITSRQHVGADAAAAR
ncbi:MAG TPA: DUF502 domain-containing protein [Burkholderiaceae bacterium]|nr:DUF502 domain-containing protein [Burkholderiaceae bacterium]